MIPNVRRFVRVSDVLRGISLLPQSLMNTSETKRSTSWGYAKDGQLKSPLYKEKAYRTDIPLCDRGVGRVVQEEPEGEHEAG
jgi:hypothetical protein